MHSTGGDRNRLLFARLREVDEGIVLRCTVDRFKCTRILSKTYVASVSENASVAVVRDMFNKPPANEEVPPDLYRVELVAAHGKPQLVAEFVFEKHRGIGVSMSPSGRFLIIEWSDVHALCKSGVYGICHHGTIVDLVGKD